MPQLQFCIDTAMVTENEFFDIMENLNMIEQDTRAELEWGEPEKAKVFLNYSFKSQNDEECAFSMMNDVHIDFNWATSLNRSNL